MLFLMITYQVIYCSTRTDWLGRGGQAHTMTLSISYRLHFGEQFLNPTERTWRARRGLSLSLPPLQFMVAYRE